MNHNNPNPNAKIVTPAEGSHQKISSSPRGSVARGLAVDGKLLGPGLRPAGPTKVGLNRRWTSVFIFLFALAGCHKSPSDRTRSAAGGPIGQAAAIATFPVFSSELKTGGGAFEYPGGDNQVLSFADRSNPISNRSIRYFWNGQPATTNTSIFGSKGEIAGFTLMHTVSETSYDVTPGRDISGFGYTTVTFYARGALSTNTTLKIEAAANTSGSTFSSCLTLSSDGQGDECGANGAAPGTKEILNSSWQKYTLVIFQPANSLKSVKDFFKATFVYFFPLGGGPPLPGEAPGQGGTVYFDQIQYEP
jgi:hypothetical protein